MTGASMVQGIYRAHVLLFCLAAFCLSLCAQSGKTITVRMVDGRTGKLIATSDFLVRIDHQQTVHANWVVENEDGTGKLTLPQNASLLSIQGTYDSSTLIYANCDSAAGKENANDTWYAVSEILASGVVAPNGCGKPLLTSKVKFGAKMKTTAKAGEFVFFVRPLTAVERFRN